LIESLIEIDRWLFLFLNGDSIQWLDGPMWFFSKTWFWFPVDAILLWQICRRFKNYSWVWVILGFALVVCLTDRTSSGIIKEWVQRLRPSREPDLQGLIHFVKDENGNNYIGGMYGFISSHAANYSGVVSLFLMLMWPLKRIYVALLVFWVVLISFSRIYLGVHYPADLVGGWIVGIISALIVYFLLRRSVLKKQPI